MEVPQVTPMKRTLSLLLGLSLFAATSVVAQEAKKDAPKKAAAPAVKLPAQQPDVAAPKFDGKTGEIQTGFANSHKSFVAIAQKGEAQVVFLGDSITAGWNGQKALFEKEYGQYKAANFGIGGDQVQHVLWRVENGEFEGIKPKAVVLMIGTNNAGNPAHTPELIANGEPIGASGLRQVHELVLQLRGTAGDRQVPGSPKVGYAQLYGAPGTAATGGNDDGQRRDGQRCDGI